MSEFQRKIVQERLRRAEALLGLSLDTDENEAEAEEEEEETDGLGALPDLNSKKLASFSSARPLVKRKTKQPPELKLPHWSDYFTHNEVITNDKGYKFQTYYSEPVMIPQEGNLNYDPDENPVIIVSHHGAGSSGLTYAKLNRSLQKKSQNVSIPGFFTFDMRGHGNTKLLNDEGNLDFSITTLCDDFRFVLNHVYETKFLQNAERTTANFAKPSIFLLGHSLGGSILTKIVHEQQKYLSQQLYSRIQGLIMLDIVEETAVRALSSMKHYLNTVPKSFRSIQSAIDWHISSGLLNSRDSALISVPELITLNTEQGTYEWIIDLNNTEPYWNDWFVGLSSNFIEIPNKVAKMLILANHDTLDKYLMIGQMQGKYQLVVFRGNMSNPSLSDTLTTATNSISGDCDVVGHFVHEDVPDKLASTILEFIERNDYGNSRGLNGNGSGSEISAQMKHLNELNKKWGVKRE